MVAKIKKTISNSEFNNARKKHLTTIQNTCKAFNGALSPDALVACGDIALWRALQSFDASFGQSFPSSLYRFVRWECFRAIQENQSREINMNGGDTIECNDNSTLRQMILDDYLSVLSNRDRRIVEARFFESCTLQEIAHREGYSRQGIKDIVDRSISIMSELAQSGV